MNRRLIYFAAAALVTLAAVASDGLDNLPVKQVNGRDCRYYEVAQGETVYSIARKLHISREEIEKANPSVRDGLRAGQILYFPVESSTWKPRRHTVQSKETIYGIARAYGITTDQLIEWNPQARDGIRKDQVLIVSDPTYRPATLAVADSRTSEPSASVSEIPQQSSPKVVDTPAPTVTYRIGEKESLYRIAVNHNTTVSTLLALNPGLDERHYEAGQTIFVPGVSSSPAGEAVASNVEHRQVAPASGADFVMGRYRVKSKETFYSIAHANGLTIEELEKANPEVGVLKEGMILNIPLAGQVASSDNGDEDNNSSDNIDPTMAVPGENPVAADDVPSAVQTAGRQEVNVALMLPLMLNQSQQPKKAQLYTEFYKGFLLAVDTMRRCGTPINVSVFDTEDSAMRVGSLLRDSSLTAAGVIIAPDDETQLSLSLIHISEPTRQYS